MPLVEFLKEYAEALDDLMKERKAMEEKQKMMRNNSIKRPRRRR